LTADLAATDLPAADTTDIKVQLGFFAADDATELVLDATDLVLGFNGLRKQSSCFARSFYKKK
jgi:hypothetical protein